MPQAAEKLTIGQKEELPITSELSDAMWLNFRVHKPQPLTSVQIDALAKIDTGNLTPELLAGARDVLSLGWQRGDLHRKVSYFNEFHPLSFDRKIRVFLEQHDIIPPGSDAAEDDYSRRRALETETIESKNDYLLYWRIARGFAAVNGETQNWSPAGYQDLLNLDLDYSQFKAAAVLDEELRTVQDLIIHHDYEMAGAYFVGLARNFHSLAKTIKDRYPDSSPARRIMQLRDLSLRRAAICAKEAKAKPPLDRFLERIGNLLPEATLDFVEAKRYIGSLPPIARKLLLSGIALELRVYDEANTGKLSSTDIESRHDLLVLLDRGAWGVATDTFKEYLILMVFMLANKFGGVVPYIFPQIKEPVSDIATSVGTPFIHQLLTGMKKVK